MPINQAWLEKRRAELDIIQQMEAESAIRRQEARKEEDEFLARGQARREALERGQPMEVAIPTFEQIFQASRDAELVERQRQEQERIAAMTPRDLWSSTLSFEDRLHIRRWENVNNMPYPVAGLE